MPRRKLLSDVEFVTAWAKAASLDEVVAATGLSRVGVQARGRRLRQAGVLLRRFARKRTVDVKGLNDLLDRLGAKGGRRLRRAR